MRYVARIERERRKTLIEFPDCPGCQTFASPNESPEAVAREALEGWLETHLEGGEAPPPPRFRGRGKGRYLPVRIDAAIAIRMQIRWARQRLGISQQDLADRVGVTRQQISLLEAKGGNLQVATLERIATALDLELEINFQERVGAGAAA